MSDVRPNLLDVLSQLAAFSEQDIDAQIASLEAQLTLLRAVRAPKAEPPAADPPAGVLPPVVVGPGPVPGPKTREMHAKMMAHLLKVGPCRSNDLARAVGIQPKGMYRFLSPIWFVKLGPERFDPWGLTPAGEAAARKLAGKKK